MERYPPPFTEEVATKTSAATNSATLISLCFQWVAGKGSEVATSEPFFLPEFTARAPAWIVEHLAEDFTFTLFLSRLNLPLTFASYYWKGNHS